MRLLRRFTPRNDENIAVLKIWSFGHLLKIDN